jgi:hypothetical protein
MRGAWLGAVIFGTLLCMRGFAQQETATIDGSKPLVLHAYANLVQVPTLILSHAFRPLPPLSKDQIFIRLDSGPAFHPVKMHIEGDEPISLAILLDVSDRNDPLMRHMRQLLPQLSQHSILTSQDTVSVFSGDCKLIRSALALPATADVLSKALEQGWAGAGLHGESNHRCANSLHLWNFTAKALETLATLPGRRVLLIISNGEDRSSSVTRNRLAEYADEKSIAIFGLRELMHLQLARGFSVPPEGGAGVYSASLEGEDPFLQLCELTGGVAVATPEKQLPESLRNIFRMVRGRYILEFPRPDDSTPGKHSVEVKIPSSDAFTTAASVTVLIPEPSRATDPTTIPSSSSPAVLGKRRVLTPH